MADLTPLHEALASNDQPRTLQPGELSLQLRAVLGDRLAFNELTLSPELDYQPIPTHEVEGLYVALSERGWKIDKRKAIDALMRVARLNSYHPVVTYLETIEVDHGIEPIDLATVARDYLGTADRLYDEMLAATLIGAVARVMDPGCKFDTCCVLKGDQGTFKSTTWRTLAAPAWFCDTPQENDKDLRLAIGTTWIYELAELDTLTSRRESGAVKALLSSPTDTFRPPYGGAMVSYPRRSIMVGTCNRDDFLRDETGARRFWIIEIRRPVDTEKILADRDRIWRAAMLAYRSGRRPILSTEWQLESERRNSGYTPEHPWLAMVARWLPKAPEAFTMDQALILSGCRLEGQIRKSDEGDMAPILKALGCKRDKHQTRTGDGSRPRLWRRSTQADSSSAQRVETGQTSGTAAGSASLSQPLNLFQEIGVGEAAGGKGASEEFPKQVETLRQPPSEGTPPPRADRVAVRWNGAPGWSRSATARRGHGSVMLTSADGRHQLAGWDEIADEPP